MSDKTTGEVEAEISVRRKNLRGIGIIIGIAGFAFTLGATYNDWRNRMDSLEKSVVTLAHAVQALTDRVGNLEHK